MHNIVLYSENGIFFGLLQSARDQTTLEVHENIYIHSEENTVNYMGFCIMISAHYLVDNYVEKKSDKFLL